MISFLKNDNDGGVFYIINKDQFIIGRKDCDFLISSDQSISRKHAIIRINGGQITLEDCGSKYNTFYNGNKMEPNIEQLLNNNDEIQFGVYNSKYRLHQLPLITTGTRLNSSQKIKLKNDLAVIGGKYIENWSSDCTHLTVEEITLTVKVLHAIIDEKPIVKPAYWSKFSENVAQNLPPPDIDKYNKPPIAEALLNNIEFKSDPKRSKLFKGKLFVFSQEKFKKQMEEIIRKAGGTSISWEKHPMPLSDIISSPKEFIIIQVPESPDNPSLGDVIKHFSKQGKRTIPLQEIAMAIVLCSCEKDCNPSFNRVEQVFPKNHPSEPTQNNALVLDTQSQCLTVKKYKEEDDEVQIIIPDTIEGEHTSVHYKKENLPSTSKSIHEKVTDTDKDTLKRVNKDNSKENPFKKVKLDNENISKQNHSSTSTKRETKDNFITKGTTSQKRSAEQDENMDKVNEAKSDLKDNPFNFLNKNKKNRIETNKSSKNDNPFKLMKTQNNDIPRVSEENPFKLSVGKKKREYDDDISDRSICKKKKEDNAKDRIFSSTRIGTDVDKSLNFSKISKINSTSNNTWYSKDTIMDSKENIEKKFDTEMQDFIDQFKDTVVVEVITQLPKRTYICQVDNLDGGKLSNGKLNFKRFVKVMPLRPQTRIIGKDSFVAIGPRDTTGITDSRRENHFSDDEVDNTLKINKKTPKKFLI